MSFEPDVFKAIASNVRQVQITVVGAECDGTLYVSASAIMADSSDRANSEQVKQTR